MQIFVVLRKISKEKNVMKQDIQRIMLAAAKPLFLIFILYILKIMEVGMDWDFSSLGVYPMEKRGLVGILTHPLYTADLVIYWQIQFLYFSNQESK